MRKAEDGEDSLPLFEEEGQTVPAEGRVLRYLAQTLSVTKTLQRFSSLTPQILQEILLKSAQRAAEQKSSMGVQPVRKEGLEFLMYADGASRGNPGEAGAGVIITDPRGRTVKEYKAFLGVTTNNVAEYRALILGLEKAWALGGNRVTAYLDSELVVRQLRGEFKVRESHLKPLHQQAWEMLQQFSKYEIHHLPREENRRADQLANEAIDQKIGET